MNKINIIKEYLTLSTEYAIKFFDLYKVRQSWEYNNILYIPHWNWLKIIDKNKWLEIDFDYFRYDWIKIKYFDIWKLNFFSKLKYDFEFDSEIINELEKSLNIKKYHKSGYYYLNDNII
jgi:hypothetical protein